MVFSWGFRFDSSAFRLSSPSSLRRKKAERLMAITSPRARCNFLRGEISNEASVRGRVLKSRLVFRRVFLAEARRDARKVFPLGSAWRREGDSPGTEEGLREPSWV